MEKELKKLFGYDTFRSRQKDIVEASLNDENIWFYFDRKLSSGKMMKFGDMDLLENNVLVLNFDKYGIVIQKEFYSKEDMKKIKYSEMQTKNPVTNQSFVATFLQSVRQKMYGKRKF